MKNAILETCLALVFCAAAAAQSTETVLYAFGAYANDGVAPSGGPLFDASGNIFGVTAAGGIFCQANGGCGTVFELSPSAAGWTESILYNFCSTGISCPDGANPEAGLIKDSAGNLYGTTSGGGTDGVGTVFQLSPPTQNGGSWTETVLWNFAEHDSQNGNLPGYGRLNMDAAGNLYGTTYSGGAQNVGTVFELSPVGNGTYTFSILHSFVGAKSDGSQPLYGVSFDTFGTLYGTTFKGGPAYAGVIYKLAQVNGSWVETILGNLNGREGANPVSSVSVGQSGRLYGTFFRGGEESNDCNYESCGGVFELAPKVGSGYKPFSFLFNGQDGGSPQAGVLVDEKAGSAYGTTTSRDGNVFKLQGRIESVLYSFCSLPNCADGSTPSYGVLIEHKGQLYGETGLGGPYNAGVLYSVTK